jgi:hypothetical protein
MVVAAEVIATRRLELVPLRPPVLRMIERDDAAGVGQPTGRRYSPAFAFGATFLMLAPDLHACVTYWDSHT